MSSVTNSEEGIPMGYLTSVTSKAPFIHDLHTCVSISTLRQVPLWRRRAFWDMLPRSRNRTKTAWLFPNAISFHPHFSTSFKLERLWLGQQLQVLPHAPAVVVQQVGVVAVGVAVLRMPDGVLVHGGVGLGGGVEGGWDAVTGLTAVVAVPVIHSTVRILICGGRRGG